MISEATTEETTDVSPGEKSQPSLPPIEVSDELEEEEDGPMPTRGSKRILLQRFTVYNSISTMYIVGSNAKETLFRILEIQRDKDNDIVDIIEEKNYFYTRKDMVELLNSLDELIEGGIHKIAQGYGLLGLIKFTADYYLCIVTKCSQVAIIGGHYVYHMDDTRLIPLDINYRRPEKYSDEEKLLSIFKYLDLGKTFYFSYGYDITNSLQTNLCRLKQDHQPQFAFNDRFVWNRTLLEPIIRHHWGATTYEWFQPIIHGFIDQASINVTGRKFYITLIARRSHYYAGARFLKRGINLNGDVANEIETEQIVSDMLLTSFHDPNFGFGNSTRWTLYVQHRGLIPLFWTQDMNKLPKPPIEISLLDPYYLALATHFNNLFERYSSPITVLNLIKTLKEKQARELKLNGHFVNCIKYLNQFLPKENKILYHGFDMSRHSKKNLDVIRPIQQIAQSLIANTLFFHNGPPEKMKLQKGIIRTNCIDCLDRTNAAQFIIGKEALLHQLQALHLMSSLDDTAGFSQLEYDLDAVNILTEMFHDHGDTIAIQYGGLNLVNTMDSYRRINQWSSHTRDILNLVKRIYLNSFMDLIRQEAINLFLGNYVYDLNRPKLWELQTDFSLHNKLAVDDIRKKISYIHWYNENYFHQDQKLLAGGDETRLWTHDSTDSWFNECYKAKKFQLFTEVFQFSMNSTLRYFSAEDNVDANDINPFRSRKRQPPPVAAAHSAKPREPKVTDITPISPLSFGVSEENKQFYSDYLNYAKLGETTLVPQPQVSHLSTLAVDKDVYNYYLAMQFSSRHADSRLYGQYCGLEQTQLEAEDDYFR